MFGFELSLPEIAARSRPIPETSLLTDDADNQLVDDDGANLVEVV